MLSDTPPDPIDLQIAQFEVVKLVRANPDAEYMQGTGALLPKSAIRALINNLKPLNIDAIVMEHRTEGLHLLVTFTGMIQQSVRKNVQQLTYVLPQELMLQLPVGSRRTLLMHACTFLQGVLRDKYEAILAGNVTDGTTAEVDEQIEAVEQWYMQRMDEWSAKD